MSDNAMPQLFFRATIIAGSPLHYYEAAAAFIPWD